MGEAVCPPLFPCFRSAHEAHELFVDGAFAAYPVTLNDSCSPRH